MTKPQSDAVFQMEVDRKRWNGTAGIGFYEPPKALKELVETLSADTMARGGTLVIVADAEKVTIVQRADAANLPKVASKREESVDSDVSRETSAELHA